jgi:hypothetical protein
MISKPEKPKKKKTTKKTAKERSEPKWKGRHYSEDSERTKKAAFEFLTFYNLGAFGRKFLIEERGYDDPTKKAFCEKHKVSINYFCQMAKSKNFQEEYFQFVTGHEREKLPAAIALLLRKDPAKWIQLHFNKQAAPLLANRNINMEGGSDDEEFRNSFFGIDKK